MANKVPGKNKVSAAKAVRSGMGCIKEKGTMAFAYDAVNKVKDGYGRLTREVRESTNIKVSTKKAVEILGQRLGEFGKIARDMGVTRSKGELEVSTNAVAAAVPTVDEMSASVIFGPTDEIIASAIAATAAVAAVAAAELSKLVVVKVNPPAASPMPTTNYLSIHRNVRPGRGHSVDKIILHFVEHKMGFVDSIEICLVRQ